MTEGSSIRSRSAARVAYPDTSSGHRRRASVLVLVMTLLGVLFVVGIAFLATVNFDADLIESDRQRDRGRAGVQAVVDELGTMLRDGLAGTSGDSFTGDPGGDSRLAFAELPASRGLVSPIEPYHNDIDRDGLVSPGEIVFGWFTDLEYLTTGEHEQEYTFDINGDIDNNGVLEIDTSLPSGKPYDDPDFPKHLLPVDADGDGITDTLAVDVEFLGFAEAQMEALSEHLNAPSSSSKRVYLGLRVIPHGGMVNLNESHPELVANVLNVKVDDLRTLNGRDIDKGFFRYRPMLARDELEKLDVRGDLIVRFYSPAMEEPMLRRRLLLPSRVTTPSLLQGNPFLLEEDYPYGESELATRLYPPLPGGDFETVYEGNHRYLPYAPDELHDPDDLDSLPAWAVRMEPFTSRNVDSIWDAYDRRHLVTTISYDDLLSRGGDVQYEAQYEGYSKQVDEDLVDRMLDVVQESNIVGTCPDEWDPPRPLPFEYIDYPQDIENGTLLNEEEEECTCPTQDICRFDSRKGRLKLSLAYLDEVFPCETETDVNRLERCKVQRQRLIHDAFMMLVRNARGPYWDDQDCTKDGQTACDNWTERDDEWTGTCQVAGGQECVGGFNDGKSCARPEDCPSGSCMDRKMCYDPVTGQTRRESLISRTAASLTANMLDYMDFDDVNGDLFDRNIPTRVALRSFDFSARWCWGSANTGDPCGDDEHCPGGTCVLARRCFGGSNDGVPCADDVHCSGGGKCVQPVGHEFGSSAIPEVPVQFVYGLERQPFITEVATAADVNEVKARAIELFNPYRVDLLRDADGDGLSDFAIVEVAPGEDAEDAVPIPIDKDLRSGEFTVLRTGAAGYFSLGGSGSATADGRVYDTSQPLTFMNGWTIYLIRRVNYAGDPRTTKIVVDQFTVDGPKTGLTVPVGGSPAEFSMQRTVQSLNSFWRIPVPDTAELAPTLGTWNTHVNNNLPPVEVNFANTGSFTKLHPADDVIDPQLGVAFPTTGSMLLLMRHANRSLADQWQDPHPAFSGVGTVTTADLAFTTWLDNTIQWQEANMSGGTDSVGVNEMDLVDNGRMPVFDIGELVDPGGNPEFGRRYLHHVDPGVGACCLPNGTCEEGRFAQCLSAGGLHHVLGAECDSEMEVCRDPKDKDRAGGVANLPWGQLVFDYFTALPLRSIGPYEDPDPEGDPNFEPGKPDSIPRVDQNGLRVHGRININAAPWKVLSGVPMMPMQRIAREFRAKTRWGAGLVDPWALDVLNPQASELWVYDNQASPIGNSLAQAIVAYRELRWIDDFDVNGNTVTTGNYGGVDTDLNGHGWEPYVPASRRGPGFMTVGELAEMRHPGASREPGSPWLSYRRIDLGNLDKTTPDYVEAVGLLVALSDWVTARSQVFTVYGTLRGELDEEILGEDPRFEDYLRAAKDVDTRAIRFQETLDRLPTLLGESVPARVGERTVGRYVDARND